METLWQDIRYGIRLLLKHPGFTAVAVLSIALGISANTTVFSWIQTVLLRPMPGVEKGEQLVTLETLTPSGEFIDSSYPDYKDFRDQSTNLSGIIVFMDRPLSLGDQERAERVWSEIVSGNYFDLLGVKPALGRFFLPEEQSETPDAHPVAVISHNLWKGHFNSDPGIVGKVIKLNQREITIVGVTPEEFHGTVVGLSYDIWVPLTMHGQLTGINSNWLKNRRSRPLHMIARLKPGVAIDQAQAEIKTISSRLAKSYKESNEGIGAILLPISKAPYGAQSLLSTILQILMGIGGLVLLIVCANVANLLLARATTRQKEIAIRLAIGGSRARVVRQLLTESLLLSILGGTIGVLGAFWMTDLLRLLIPKTELPVTLYSKLDPQVLLFTLLLSLFTGLLFGLAPAIQITKPDLYLMIKEGGRSSMEGSRSQRLRKLLVISEVALASVALIGAGLFLKSFHNAKNTNPGFDPENVLLVGFDLSTSGYNREQGKAFLKRLREQVESLPGVKSVSYSEDVPLGFDGGSWEDIQIDGYTPNTNENMKVYRNLVDPGYFNLMRIELLEGRDFTERDNENTPPAMIVNDAFVRRFFPDRDPIGRQVRAWGRVFNIVGVVKQIKYRSISESPQAYMYLPLSQFYNQSTGVALHVRTQTAPEALLEPVRTQVHSIDPSVSIFGSFSLSEYISASLFMQKMAAILLTLLGALALLLSALGLYSVMAYTVMQRTHEIGIRMALGAQQRDIIRLVVGQGLRLSLIGTVFGLAIAFVITRLTSSLLFGVSAKDPATFIVISTLITIVALLACYIPARRAMSVDPMVALRYE